MSASLALQDARVLARALATAAPGRVSDALAQVEARLVHAVMGDIGVAI